MSRFVNYGTFHALGVFDLLVELNGHLSLWLRVRQEQTRCEDVGGTFFVQVQNR